MLKKTFTIVGLLFMLQAEVSLAQNSIVVEMEDGSKETIHYQENQIESNNEKKTFYAIEVEMEDGTKSTIYFQENQISKNNREKHTNSIEIELEDGTKQTMLIAKNAIIQEDVYQEDKEEISIPAQFPGGEKKLHSYIIENFTYPQKMKKMEKNVDVFVHFIIKKDGSIVNPKIIDSTNDIFNEQALELVKSMPNWEPAVSVSGEIMDSEYILPLSF